MFTWRRSDGANFLVEARTRSAGGTLRPFTTLSDPGQSAFEPQVAVDDDGDAAVTWRRSDGANTRIQASAGPQRRTPPGCVPARQPFISPPWVPERLTARRRDPVVSARQLLRYEAEPSAFEAQKTAVDDSRLCRKRG